MNLSSIRILSTVLTVDYTLLNFRQCNWLKFYEYVINLLSIGWHSINMLQIIAIIQIVQPSTITILSGIAKGRTGRT